MGLRFMIDGIIQMREENALADTNKFDVLIDVIKFVVHILECDPEDNASEYLVHLVLTRLVSRSALIVVYGFQRFSIDLVLSRR